MSNLQALIICRLGPRELGGKNSKESCTYHLTPADRTERTKELGGGNIRKIFCPITGQYTFMYDLYNQTDNRVECSPALSHLENCADRAGGPQLDVHFQGCSHQYNDVTFDCLGDWAGTDGQRFLALYDTSVLAGTDYRPQYRCALYKQDEQNGNVIIAFSSDSTCTTDLYNASYGHMTWNLTVVPSSPWPAQVTNSKCSFPYWSQGKWERFNINHNTLTYKDHTSFNTYTMRCVEAVDEGKLIVFSRNGCGEETYKCIQLKQRSRNVVEFQFGLTTSSFVNHSLCSDSNFLGNVWITQARLEGLQVSPCPVTGEYSGVIPDPNNVGLCARLASDQTHQEIMYFTVFDCDQQEVYEGRYHSGRHQREVEEGVYNSTVDEITTSTSKGDLLSVSNTSTGNVGTDSGRTTDSSQTKLNVSDLGFSSGFSLEVTKPYTYTSVTDSVSSVMRTTTESTESPISSGYPTTYRPNRSFQPEYPWNPHVTWPSTLPWYSVHNNKNLSTPQWTTFSPIGSGRGYAGFPNNYRERDWTKSSPPFDVSNVPYNGMNYWNPGFPREEFRIRTPSGLFVQHATSRNYINSTRTPIEPPRFPGYSGNRDRNYQNTRNNWNWNGRWLGRNPMVYTYRPYQRNNGNGRQPIALPPIQLPPLYPDIKTLHGSSSVGRRPLAIEEREYQCLGQWEEDGVTYTYTQRKDFGTYECFVGSIVSNNDIYIKEAGEHCGRGINPKHMGMKLQTKVNIRPPETTQPVTSWYVTSRPSSPTRPWKPITEVTLLPCVKCVSQW
ncbi:hypothetical protein J6590_009237 [Homalodisca vitripennis]|nr:hypothetical protein J6590_009237 [Homalodisca vitripennis]